MNRLRSQVREGWRKSQGWIGWSLVGPPILDRNRSKGRQQGRGHAKGKSLGEDPPGHTWSRHWNVPEQKEEFVEIINAEVGLTRAFWAMADESVWYEQAERVSTTVRAEFNGTAYVLFNIG